jgi:Nucleoside recognition
MGDLARTFLSGSFELLLRMFLIVVPIMVVLELFEGTRAYDRAVRAFARLVGRWLGLRGESAAPTLIGFLFGLAYGGALIVRDTRRHNLGRRQIFLMSVFLSMVHAVVEDSLIFIALGASIFWVVVYRVAWAAFVTLVLGAVAGMVIDRQRKRAS